VENDMVLRSGNGSVVKSDMVLRFWQWICCENDMVSAVLAMDLL